MHTWWPERLGITPSCHIKTRSSKRHTTIYRLRSGEFWDIKNTDALQSMDLCSQDYLEQQCGFDMRLLSHRPALVWLGRKMNPTTHVTFVVASTADWEHPNKGDGGIRFSKDMTHMPKRGWQTKAGVNRTWWGPWRRRKKRIFLRKIHLAVWQPRASWNLHRERAAFVVWALKEPFWNNQAVEDGPRQQVQRLGTIFSCFENDGHGVENKVRKRQFVHKMFVHNFGAL